jgi:16S rRNA (cytosine1402-N4)-methyltransferase
LEATSPDGRLLGIDRDEAAIARAQQRLVRFGERVTLRHGSFGEVGAIAHEVGFVGVQGVLLDLGISSDQLDSADRGFSFQVEGPLDMRMDPNGPLTAEEIVNEWSQDHIADVIYQYADEPRSRRIARAIVAGRPLRTTTQLADVVARALGREKGRRIIRRHKYLSVANAVNDELERWSCPPANRLCSHRVDTFIIIAFHSLEDRLVKQFAAGSA